MVFFTCNHCGESLKKPAVDKHYTWKSCKNAPPFLTCVDCLKDFRGDEFRAHTKCITEDEKYSAKGYVAKAEKNKGAQKQDAWTEIIQAQLTQRKDLDPTIRNMLERIASQSNVPRKKQKFLNFVTNCMRTSPQVTLKIWSVVEAALEEFTKKADVAKAEAAAARKIVDDERIAAKKAAEAAKAEAAGESADVKAPKKEKKSKKSAANGENEVTSTTEETDQPANGEVTKKKKKDKKRKLEENDADLSTTSADAKKAKGSVDVAEDGAASFEWKKEITAVLTKKNNIKLEKLRAKVLKRLVEVTGAAETTPKDEKKFQKHLEKLSNFVSVEGEKVKLLVAE